MKLDYSEFVEELRDIAWDDMINRQQKTTFVLSTVKDFLRELTHQELKEIQSAIRAADENT